MKKKRNIKDGTYIVRKVRKTTSGTKVYLHGILFHSFKVNDNTIKEYTIVVLKNGKLSRKPYLERG